MGHLLADYIGQLPPEEFNRMGHEAVKTWLMIMERRKKMEALLRKEIAKK